VFRVRAKAGDLVILTFQFQAVSGIVEVRDDEDKTVRRLSFTDPKGEGLERVVGFVAKREGAHHVRVIANDSSRAGSFVLSLKQQASADRVSDVTVNPAQESLVSPRISKLAREVAANVTNAETTFWSEVSRGGGPIVEDLSPREPDVLVTFVWREIYDTRNVRLASSLDFEDPSGFYLDRVPGTSVWHKTLRLRRDTRFRYGFSPNDREGEREFTVEWDPLNPKRFPEEADPLPPNVLSVFELANAPDLRWWRESPVPRGLVQPVTFNSALLKPSPDVWVYTPPGYRPEGGPYPLIILFDAWAYVRSEIHAPVILDNLIAAQRIKSAVVCFVDSPNRVRDMRFNSVFADVIAKELLPQLKQRYPISPSTRNVIVGGFSIGAVGAAYIGHRHPDSFGSVLIQSGAFRVADETGQPEALARLYRSFPPPLIRFYIDAGAYEGNIESNRRLRDVLVTQGHEVIYKETGGVHEPLHILGALPEALMALLPLER
jgi:enterochelin esterase family protein